MPAIETLKDMRVCQVEIIGWHKVNSHSVNTRRETLHAKRVPLTRERLTNEDSEIGDDESGHGTKERMITKSQQKLILN